MVTKGAKIITNLKILDNGYLKLIEHWGSDKRIVEAARMSTDKGFLGWIRLVKCPKCGREMECENKPAYCNNSNVITCVNVEMEEVHPGDRKLLRYLYSNYHDTPFEMAGLVIEVQAPIMVFREWHRHRTQSYNEMSARYIPLPDVNYLPTVDRCIIVSAKNKQTNSIKDSEELTHESVIQWLEKLNAVYGVCESTYQDGLKRGIPKELARLCVPVGRYSRMRASANLRNWLAFMTLRSDKAAQWEIRQYSLALGNIIAEIYPHVWALFNEWMQKKTPRLS